MKFFYLLLLSVFLCLFSEKGLAAPTKQTLSTEDFNHAHRCQKNFKYEIFLAGANIGYLQRTVNWQNKNQQTSATITSAGEVSIFWIGSTYHQTSNLQWSAQLNHFLTPSFSQKLTGIKAREMSATLTRDGKKSTVILNDKTTTYINNNGPLYDLDTFGAQLRLNLMKGLTDFILYRQGSDEIKKYHFKVVGKEIIDVEKWGKVNTIKIKEVGEYKKLVLWFSPKHDFQLIKANIDAFISPTVFLTKFTKNCADSPSVITK